MPDDRERFLAVKARLRAIGWDVVNTFKVVKHGYVYKLRQRYAEGRSGPWKWRRNGIDGLWKFESKVTAGKGPQRPGGA